MHFVHPVYVIQDVEHKLPHALYLCCWWWIAMLLYIGCQNRLIHLLEYRDSGSYRRVFTT